VSEKHSDEAFRQIVSRLSAAGSMLVVGHSRPDGDSLGSMVALSCAAQAAGKKAHMLVPGSLPARYEFLVAGMQMTQTRDFEQLAEQVDVIVILDTCAFAQLDGLEQHLRKYETKIVVVDHHATNDEIGSARWMDTTAAAVGVMVGELFDAMGWPIDRKIAEALTVAVTSDTGWLRFPKTDARTLRAVARWTEIGVSLNDIFVRLYQSDRPERLRLFHKMLDSLELHFDDQLAVMVISKADFEQTGARPDETEDMVNEALRLRSVEAVVLLTENDNCVRVSLRSRNRVDVAKIAKGFGGGGHPRAAGIRSNKSVEQVKASLIKAIGDALKRM